MTYTPAYSSIQVNAPTRLHLGFLDLCGQYGRHFGSLGMTLDHMATSVTVTKAEQLSITGEQQQQAMLYSEQLINALSIPEHFHLHINAALALHQGLGSGTQLALAVSQALKHFYALPHSINMMAHILQRGTRSGIGIAAFEHGGFLLDSGQSPTHIEPPKIISRLDFPESWRILLVCEQKKHSLSGHQEHTAFHHLPHFENTLAAELCQLTVMQILPAIAHHDFQLFTTGISHLQKKLGDYFSPLQRGGSTSKKISTILDFLAQKGAGGCGKSTGGVIGFAFADSAQQATYLATAAMAQFSSHNITVTVYQGRNHGAEIHYPLINSTGMGVINPSSARN